LALTGLASIFWLFPAHAEMTAFGERVNSNSVPDSPTSSNLPAFPAVSAPHDPYAITPKTGEFKPSSFDLTSSQKNNKPSSAKPKATPVPTPPLVPLIDLRVKTYQAAQPEIHFFLRLPEGHAPEKPTAKGVLAFCTWERADKSLAASLRNENSPIVKYAKRHGLALLTWNTAILWKTGLSYNQLNVPELRKEDLIFDEVARAWAGGVKRICRDEHLPESGILLYGISAGAHWSQRLAVRMPNLFLAVHIHVANSYDRPTCNYNAQIPLWLVSSGDLDRGRNNAVAFYHSSQALGIPMILKIANGLGHADCPEIDELRNVFFDYAAGVSARCDKRKPSELMLEDLNNAKLTGDLLTQLVYRGPSSSKIPQEQRVPLPDENVAKAWGYIRK